MRFSIGGSSRTKVRVTEDHAVVKVLSKKHIPVFALEQALGRVWCPLRGGIECKGLG